MTATKKIQPNDSLKESEKKWGKPAIAAGFTVIPSTLLLKQHALGLDCIDIVLILQILKHWWRKDNAPFPSQGQLAKTMGTDRSTVKRHLKRLRELGFIAWTARSNKYGGQASNYYDLSGLIDHVNKFAINELEERGKKADERKARASRKRPGGASLRLVRDEEIDND